LPAAFRDFATTKPRPRDPPVTTASELESMVATLPKFVRDFLLNVPRLKIER